MSILAINSKGLVTRANMPARKALAPASRRPEGTELGVLLAGTLASGGRSTRRTMVSFRDGEDEREDLLLVLSGGEEHARQDQPEGAPLANLAGRHRALNPLADFIAHELRNPLGAILGFSQVLENRYASMSEEDRETALDTIQTEAERSLLILEGLLRLAQARAKPELEVEIVPLHAVLRKVVTDHIRRNPHRSLVLSGDSPLFARANSLWVELAVGNLLSNAEKYTPKDVPIEMVFHQNGSESTVMILDSGSGLKPELYPLLWDVYSKGPDREVAVIGSGIGLALCKELVEGMGGHVWAGPRYGGGSAFAIRLPGPWEAAVPAPLATAISESVSEVQGGSSLVRWN
jgi:signal transduction histidine kinase